MTTQQRFHSTAPKHHLTALTVQPFHLKGHLLFCLGGHTHGPSPTATLRRQLCDHRSVLAYIQSHLHRCVATLLQTRPNLYTIDIHGPIRFALHGDDLLYVERVFLTEHHYSTFEASPLSTPSIANWADLSC